MSDDTDRELFCKLDEALNESRRPKVETLFLEKLQNRRETEEGYAFEFPSDDESCERVFEFVDAERKCCPFFRFDVTVEPDEGPIWLEIGGSDRVKSFVEENLLEEIDSMAEA